ncbi:MFS transporter [Nibricoccus sp. IMCC34717]|uniref:MFS transporter n=1 Tax=Nibricoccus sp. IMCC34717 TaxID=3034021 RepID=UPI00384AA4EA
MSNPARLGFIEKFGYGLGDVATNFIFQTMMFFQLSFYTDTFGLSAAQAGTLFLVVRVFDAFVDPVVGMLADRTKTRWGQFRPWIIGTAIPMGVLAVLTFTTPNLSPGSKLLYAYVTYTLLMVMYSASNIPYSALSGVMSDDDGERASISTYRFVAAFSGGFIIQVFVIPLVHKLGEGDMQRGYQHTMILLCSLSVLMFWVTFATTRERITPPASQKSTIRQDLSDLGRNGPWISLFSVSVLLFIAMSVRGGANIYYYKYYFGREDLLSWGNAFGVAATIVGVLLSKPLAKRFDKKAIFQFALLSSVVLSGLMFLVPPEMPWLAIVIGATMAITFAPSIPLLWTMMADVADYGEWKYGRRATGIIFSAVSFGFKAGMGVGGFIAAKILDLHGYIPNVAQSAESLLGIRLSVTLYGTAPYLLGSCALLFYPLTKAACEKISTELRARRQPTTLNAA